jgi:uncharacterized protein YndB with AHSA1/START domain
MTAGSSAAAPAAAPELLLTRVFDAPRRLVYRAWTQPERAALWWGPQGFITLSCAMDVRPGGAWRLSMRSPEGTVHTKGGVYREVVEPERLVFTYAWEDAAGRRGHEMLVTVRFADRDGKTVLTLHQAGFESAAARDAHEGGWTSCMARFADYLAGAQA